MLANLIDQNLTFRQAAQAKLSPYPRWQSRHPEEFARFAVSPRAIASHGFMITPILDGGYVCAVQDTDTVTCAGSADTAMSLFSENPWNAIGVQVRHAGDICYHELVNLAELPRSPLVFNFWAREIATRLDALAYLGFGGDALIAGRG